MLCCVATIESVLGPRTDTRCQIMGHIMTSYTEHISNTTWFVQGNTSPQPDPIYACNAEETDTRLWLHAKQTQCEQLLVLSPDTDVCFIGLSLQCARDKEIILQISDMNSRESSYFTYEN